MIRRYILLTVGFVLAFGAILYQLDREIAAAGIDSVKIQSDTVTSLPLLVKKMEDDRKFAIRHRILILGDSMILPAKGMENRDTLSFMLDERLAAGIRGPLRQKVYRYAFPGAGYSTFYFIADALIATGADQVIIEFSLTSLSPRWRHRWARTDHVGWSGWRNLHQTLSLPLVRLGITTDRALWTVACVELGCADWWMATQRAQLRVKKLYEHRNAEFESATRWQSKKQMRTQRIRELNSARFRKGRPSRRSAAEYERAYAESIAGLDADNIGLLFLEATVDRFESAGIPTFVYLTPINVEAMIERGVWDQEGIDLSISTLKGAVTRAGGRFVDFHDLVPDASFRDVADHLTYKGDGSGHNVLIDHLVPIIREEMHRSRTVKR